MADAVRWCRAYRNGEIKQCLLRSKDSPCPVPWSTLKSVWLKPDEDICFQRDGRDCEVGLEYWQAKFKLKHKDIGGGGGRPSLLGDACEKVIILKAQQDARGGFAWGKHDLENVLREAAILKKIVVPGTNRLYDDSSDMRGMVSGIYGRASKWGMGLREKRGQGLSVARVLASDPAGIIEYGRKVDAGLVAFQEKNGIKMGLHSVCNFDEFANAGQAYGNTRRLFPDDGTANVNMLTALEQAKHITLFAATQGGKQLDLLAIVGGSSENLANPAHLELCVGEKPKLWLAQQESAYMDSAFFFFFFFRAHSLYFR